MLLTVLNAFFAGANLGGIANCINRPSRHPYRLTLHILAVIVCSLSCGLDLYAHYYPAPVAASQPAEARK